MNTAIYYNNILRQSSELISNSFLQFLTLTEKNKYFASLWKQFFNAIRNLCSVKFSCGNAFLFVRMFLVLQLESLQLPCNYNEISPRAPPLQCYYAFSRVQFPRGGLKNIQYLFLLNLYETFAVCLWNWCVRNIQ